MKISLQFVSILFAIFLGLIVGEYFDPTSGFLIHWDQFIDPYISKYIYLAGTLIKGMVLSVFLLVPIKYYRLPMWVLVILAYLALFIVYLILGIKWYGFSILFAIESFIYDFIPYSIGVFSVLGVWYFIVENLIQMKFKTKF